MLVNTYPVYSPKNFHPDRYIDGNLATERRGRAEVDGANRSH
jgi:hypothetical protein